MFIGRTLRRTRVGLAPASTDSTGSPRLRLRAERPTAAHLISEFCSRQTTVLSWSCSFLPRVDLFTGSLLFLLPLQRWPMSPWRVFGLRNSGRPCRRRWLVSWRCWLLFPPLCRLVLWFRILHRLRNGQSTSAVVAHLSSLSFWADKGDFSNRPVAVAAGGCL